MNKPKQRPRVMEVITRLIRGGAQEVTVLIVLRLLREGYDVVFAHGPGDESLLKMLPKDHARLTRLYIPEFRRRILPFQDLMALYRLWSYMRKYPVQLIHTHTSKAGIIGRWAAHLAGVPVIVHSPRGSIYHPTYYPEIILNFFSMIERATASFTDKIITLNESEKVDYIRYRIAPPEKFTTIYSGIEMSRFIHLEKDVSRIKIEFGIPEGRPLVGYVSRMTPEKGHILCLDAFQRVIKEVPEAMLVLVGGGPLENEIRSEVQRRGLDNQVVFTGFQTNVEALLPIFDCCVQTSLWDGLPRAMVEAMVAERPVVATSVGGIPEIIHHQKTGILVPEKDAQAIAEGVVYLLKHPQKARELGQNGRRRMEEVFDVDLSVEKLFALYAALLSQKGILE
ncbi:MAG: glycosyltransferase family 1 protein [Candidatus Omnitrophica bacterium]|nr:glycosyltransferase family 1 protein [Candidatus Omnitrophota bacterium]